MSGVVSVTCLGSFFPRHFHIEFINGRKHEKKHAQWFGDSGQSSFDQIHDENDDCPLGSDPTFPSSTLAQISNGLLQVDLEQTQRLVEREEGLSLAHKFNCSFYETSAAHRSKSLIFIISAIFLQFVQCPGATWMMSSTRWSERLERETRRESSKKTKHRVGKKFGTIFSKRSSAAGARFKETSFVQFFLNSDRSFVTFN